MAVSETELAAISPAPRVTEASIKDKIAEVIYLHPIDTLTLCILRMGNGFLAVGESACVSPENYDQDIGERIAFDDAFKKLWALEGYVLRYKLMGA